MRAMYLSASAVAVSTWGAISSARPLPFFRSSQIRDEVLYAAKNSINNGDIVHWET